MLECHQFDSSRLGELVLVAYGPDNTFKEPPPPSRPVSPRGLASDMSVNVATMTVAEFEAGR